MAKEWRNGVAARVLDDTGLANGLSHGALHQRLVDVVAALLPGPSILPATLLGEDPLPTPLGGRVRVLAVEGVRQEHAPPAGREVALVEPLDPWEVTAERSIDRIREHRHPVPSPLAVAHRDLAPRELKVFHAEVEALHETQPRTVQQGDDQPLVSGQTVEDRPRLFPGQHDGQAPVYLARMTSPRSPTSRSRTQR